jgi:hypothetical protein
VFCFFLSSSIAHLLEFQLVNSILLFNLELEMNVFYCRNRGYRFQNKFDSKVDKVLFLYKNLKYK